jgi:hypothetical protein
LTIANLELTSAGAGTGGLLKAARGSVHVTDSVFHLSGGIDSTAIYSAGADVAIARSSIDASAAMTSRGIDISRASLVIDGLLLSCDSSVRLFDAIRAMGAEVAISNLRLDASPDHAASGVTVARSHVVLERSFLKVRGGTSSCRLVNADDSKVTIASSYVDIDWRGTVDVLSANNGSDLNAVHLTMVVEAPRATLLTAMNSRFIIANSIANFSGAVSTLVRSEPLPAQGSIASNCLWGFTNLIDGSGTKMTLGEFNSQAAVGVPNFLEEPSKTFTGNIKGLWRLSRSSACVDGGIEVAGTSKIDLFGTARPSLSGLREPDIGAEELN